ncbi:MAG: hypothetical protein IJ088_14685 [Clostridia bacterium]|nr:hypothetical protein [Clostridia bacterium]
METGTYSGGQKVVQREVMTMSRYVLFNDDVQVALFTVYHSVITEFTPQKPDLLPMQIRHASAEGFSSWLRERAIDLNNVQHRNLMKELVGSRDKLTLAIRTHMFSISDTYTCFEEGEFIPRHQLCKPQDQNTVSDYFLISSDTSLRKLCVVTPNASTDGSFTKTWRFEEGNWWLYKFQSSEATRAEVEISRVLRKAGWDAAEYAYVGRYRGRDKTRSFLQAGEFFEPYDSFRFFFDDPDDDDAVIYRNIASLGASFEVAWKRILLADALFANTDRHMRNFGFIRSSVTGEVLRLAPNFDNNQAYLANPGGNYSEGMLRMYMKQADSADRENLRELCDVLPEHPYLKQAWNAARVNLNG